MSGREQLYEQSLDGWKILEKIGGGSEGKTSVYHIERQNADNWKEENALKVVSIMDESGKLSMLSEDSRNAYLKELEQRKKAAETELQTMYELRGLPNIMTFLGHKFVDWENDDRFGCDLLIRMELMQCLLGSNGQLTVSSGDAAKIGVDVCRALVECHKRHIIHRDIKPANIFRSRHGEYALGDFGISRSLNDSKFATTGICTEAYAAPEQLFGRRVSSTSGFTSRQTMSTSSILHRTQKENNQGNYGYTELVDIYSLGLTLYEICNNGCLPFAESRYANRSSLEKRLTEKKLPPPKNASDELAKIILKACSYDPENRYQSAQEMLMELDPDSTLPKPLPEPRKKNKHVGTIVAVLSLLLCVGAVAWFALPHIISKTAPDSTKESNAIVSDLTESSEDAIAEVQELAPQTTTEKESELDQQIPLETQLADEPEEAGASALPEPETQPAQAEQKNEEQPKTEQTTQNEPKQEPAPIAVKSVTLSQNELSMKNGGNANLTASVSPQNADDRTVTWKSSDSSVVTVKNGKLSALSDGTAIITASAGGKNAKCTVTVQTVWSDWMDSLPAGVASETEARTLYRYTAYRKDTTESYSSAAPMGYSLEYTTQEEESVPEQVVDVDGHYEYRYGCWVGANGGHSYCNVMAEEYYGAPAELSYTSWSTDRFQRVGTGGWGCGYSDDTSGHQHVVSGDSWTGQRNSRWYPLYSSNGSTKSAAGYYWEESRWVDTTYKTEYKSTWKTVYHYYCMVVDYESPWSTDNPGVRDNWKVENKQQYRYMITD